MLTASKKQELFSSVLKRNFVPDLLLKCKRTLSDIGKLDSQKTFQLVRRAMDHLTKEESILNVAFDTYITKTESYGLSANAFGKVAMLFCEEPEVQDIAEHVHDKIIEAYQALERGDMLWDSLPPDLFTIPFSTESLIQNITDSVSEKYSPTDERELSSDDRKLRRMDSMARLLSLRLGLSVCSSVTLDTTQSESRFIIGANVGKNGDQEEILTLTARRLQVIQDFLATIPITEEPEIHVEHLDGLAKELVRQILPFGGTSLPVSVLEQAAFKLIHSYYCDDDETFNQTEKRAFHRSAPAVIVVPKIIDIGKAQIHARTIRGDGCDDSFYELPNLPRNTIVQNIHAEQLMGHFLFAVSEIPPETKFDFGVSKLCCRTCFNSIKTAYPNVALRGQHGQVYQGVVDLQSGEGQMTSSLRPATTHSWQSPKETPYQQRRQEARDIQRKARKRLGEAFSESKEGDAAMESASSAEEENLVAKFALKRARVLSDALPSCTASGSSTAPQAPIVEHPSTSNQRYRFRFGEEGGSSCLPSNQRRIGNPDVLEETSTSQTKENYIF